MGGTDTVPRLLFLILLAHCVLRGSILFGPIGGIQPRAGSEMAVGEPVEHPQYPSMERAASGPQGNSLLFHGLAFGILQMVFAVGLLSLATWKRPGLGAARIPLLLGGLIGCLVLGLLFYSYQDYMQAAAGPRFLGLPLPTALLLFGIWTFPLF